MVSEQCNNSSVYVANENPLNRVRVERSYFVNNNFKTNTHFDYSWFCDPPWDSSRRAVYIMKTRSTICMKKDAFFFPFFFFSKFVVHNMLRYTYAYYCVYERRIDNSRIHCTSLTLHDVIFPVCSCRSEL